MGVEKQQVKVKAESEAVKSVKDILWKLNR